MWCENWIQIWLQVHTIHSPDITLLFTHAHNCGAHSNHVPKYVWFHAFTVVIAMLIIAKGRSSLQWVVWTVGKISHRADTTCVTVTQPPTHHMDYNQVHFGRGYCSTPDQASRRCSSFSPQALKLLACLLPPLHRWHVCEDGENCSASPHCMNVPPSFSVQISLRWASVIADVKTLFGTVWNLIYTKCIKSF